MSSATLAKDLVGSITGILYRTAPPLITHIFVLMRQGERARREGAQRQQREQERKKSRAEREREYSEERESKHT